MIELLREFIDNRGQRSTVYRQSRTAQNHPGEWVGRCNYCNRVSPIDSKEDHYDNCYVDAVIDVMEDQQVESNEEK